MVKAQINSTDIFKINLFRKGAKKVYINDLLLKKQSSIKNYIRSVSFSSSDINIIRGEPNFRRIWLDKVVAQLEPVYFDLLSRYTKLLKQRSHFWRSELSKNPESKNLLDSFDSQLALIGARILRRRNRALSQLKPHIEYWHNHLCKSIENIDLTYISSIQNFDNIFDNEKEIVNQLSQLLLSQRNVEEITSKCTVGPHRDDIEFLLNGVSVRKYGSSGQQRTITLALKMAELDLLRKKININPILILDDVLAELDLIRQKLLLQAVGNKSQCFISATHIDKFNKIFLEKSQLIYL